jgi:hypothetical protein
MRCKVTNNSLIIARQGKIIAKKLGYYKIRIPKKDEKPKRNKKRGCAYIDTTSFFFHSGLRDEGAKPRVTLFIFEVVVFVLPGFAVAAVVEATGACFAAIVGGLAVAGAEHLPVLNLYHA